MSNRPVPLLSWPASPQLLQAAASDGCGLIVIGIATPHSNLRETAREWIRLALHQALSHLLERPAETIQLISQPGQPLRLAPPDQHIGLSISHEPGLSLAAIYQHGVVGIDLMRVDAQPDWLSDWDSVANSYLGSQARERIAKQPRERRAYAFAQEWTRLEARLKCHGLPLTESTSALERRLDQCNSLELELPTGLIGTVAILRQADPRQ